MIYPPSLVERYGDPVPGIELLLTNGAAINMLSDDGKTALDVAIEQRTTPSPLCSENAEASAPTSYPDARPSSLGGISSYARLPPRAIIEIPSHRTWGSVGIGRRA